MADQNTQPKLWLVEPRFRRWLSDDTSDLFVRPENLAPQQLAMAKATCILEDQDTGADQKLAVAWDNRQAWYRITRPNIHFSGKLQFFLESANGQTIVQSHWRLAQVDVKDPGHPPYIDSRGVLFHQQAADFPLIVFLKTSQLPKAMVLQQLATAGATGIACAEAFGDVSAAQNWLAGLANAKLAGLLPASAKDDALARLDPTNLLGRLLRLDASTALAASYAPLRRADPSRILVARADGAMPTAIWEKFEDVVWVAPSDVGNWTSRGWTVFAELPTPSTASESSERTLLETFYKCLSRGASGFILPVDIDQLSRADFLAGLSTLASPRRVVTHGTPLSLATEAKSSPVVLWGRHEEDRLMLVAHNPSKQAEQIQVGLPTIVGELRSVLDSRKVGTSSGVLSDRLTAGAVHVYTNDQAVSGSSSRQ